MLTGDLTSAFLINLTDSVSLLSSPIFSMSDSMTDGRRGRGSKFDANYFTFRRIPQELSDPPILTVVYSCWGGGGSYLNYFVI